MVGKIWKLPESWESLVLAQFDMISNHEDPFTVRTVLRNIGAHTSIRDLDAMAKELNISASQAEFIVGKLADINFVDPNAVLSKNQISGEENIGIKITEQGAAYVKHDLDSLIHSLPKWQWSRADSSKSRSSFRAVASRLAPFFDLSYTNSIKMDVPDIVAVSDQVLTELTSAFARQDDLIKALFAKYGVDTTNAQLPRFYYTEDLEKQASYFQRLKENKTMHLHYHQNHATIDEAFERGFERAIGAMKLDSPYKIRKGSEEEETITFPFGARFETKDSAITVLEPELGVYVFGLLEESGREKGNARVIRPDSWLWKQDIRYQRAGFEKLGQVLKAASELRLTNNDDEN